MKEINLKISGMTCGMCVKRVEEALGLLNGIKNFKVDIGKANIYFDEKKTDKEKIERAICDKGYGIGKKNTWVYLIVIIALFFALNYFRAFWGNIPLAENGMALGAIFIVGLFTSLHCVAMCGGICLTQTVNKTSFAPSVLYNLGRVISYTVLGGIVGAIGSIFVVSGSFRGIIQIVAGALMVIIGTNMIFPFLKIPNLKSNRNMPFVVGLLNGLMPCGPLLAMQAFALSTGSAVNGALAMLVFSLGTVPLMLGFGFFASLMSRKFATRIVSWGAVLVVVMGMLMFTQGVNISGSSSPQEVEVAGEVQEVNSTLKAREYPSITVEKGKAVRWVINAPKNAITGCNRTMIIPEFGIEWTFATGENVIEFVPNKRGKFNYSCWMGMIRGNITIK